MAIQMRRGAYDDFDPSKMRAGEWAVSTDNETSKQQVWMCFAPGIVKRIGTFEDFDVEIRILFQSYMDDISNSVNTARGYANTATTQASNAAASATNAKVSETNAANSRKTAQSYAVGGTQSRAGEDTDNAKYYSQQASASKTAAATSAANAKASETNAANKSSSASTSASNAAKSESNAKTYATTATSKASEAFASATTATAKANEAKASATSASTSATNAKTSETNAKTSENESQKYAEQAKSVSESLSGALKPKRTINFADLPSTADANSGDMYNIIDQFVTTTDFIEGSGNIIPAGSNVYLTIDRYWDVLAGTPVTGVKGSSESIYRRGNVNITKANVGLGNVGNFKAVSTVANQGLSDAEKANARNNIGAGTSSFSGNYNDLSNKPISKYNASANYSYGNIVDYNNKFYRMIMKPASGTTGMIKNIIPTNTTYWKEITITDLAKEMSDATNIMTSLTASTFDFSNIGVTGETKYTVEESLSQIVTALSTLNGNLNSKSNIGHTHDDRYQKLLVREKQSFSITVSPQGNTSYEKVFTKTGYTPIITVATLGSYGDKASLNQAWDIASGYAKCYGYVGYWGTDSNCNIWVEIQILWVKN